MIKRLNDNNNKYPSLIYLIYIIIFSQTQDAISAEINASVKQWPSDIKRQAGLVKSSFPGTVEKEINFWKDLGYNLLYN